MAVVLLDTNIVISLLNTKDSMHGPALSAVREWEHQGAEFPLSVIVWSEVLSGALRHRGKSAVQNLEGLKKGFFSATIPVNLEIANHAAKLRAANHPGLKTPDALILASGVDMSADAVLTADKRLESAAPELVQLVTC